MKYIGYEEGLEAGSDIAITSNFGSYTLLLKLWGKESMTMTETVSIRLVERTRTTSRIKISKSTLQVF